MARIYKFDRGCQLALNLDRVNAVDVIDVEGKWCVRFFFAGTTNNGYTISTPDKETADYLYNEIVKAMEG